MRLSFARTLGLVATLLAGAATAFAQTSSGDAAAAVRSCTPNPAAPRATVEGKVTDNTGAGLSGVNVSAQCGSFRQDTRTVADGTYALTAPSGSYVLVVEASGFQTATRDAKISPDAPGHADFQLDLGSFQSIITVTAPGGYVAPSSTTATKTGAPLIEIPQSVSVVTFDEMADRNVQTINQAISYTPSVDVNTFGTETRFDWINIRGFDQSTYGLYRDNSRWQSGQVSGSVDPYLIQEIDVVKGPSSVLYGQNAPGGLVNLVTKRPSSAVSREVAVSYGDYDRQQAQADFTGPLGDGGTLSYRLTGLYRKSDTQVDFVPDDRWFIAPALTWAPTSQTTLTVLGDYQYDDTGWSQFLPSQGVLTPNPNGKVDPSTFVGEPDYDYFHRHQWSAGTLFEHNFNDTWAVRNTARYSSIRFDGKTVFGGGLQDDLRHLNRFGYGNTLDLALFTMDTNLVANRIVTGAVQHSLLFGVDYSASTAKQRQGISFPGSLDIFDPVYGSPVPDLFYYDDTHRPIDLLGLYVQDHMKIASRWVVTLAARHDWADAKSKNQLTNTEIKQDDTAFTGRVGATYLADNGLAPYVSYATSFLPTAGTDFGGKPFEPVKGKQAEGGLKYQPKGSNSFVTASIFQINETNVSVPDPDPTHPFAVIQQGEIRSRGYELEALGNIWTSLNFHASYSHLDQEITETTDPTALGKRPPLAPKSLLGVSLEYTVTSGALTGLGATVGVRDVGSRAGDNANTIEIPSYTLLDASLRYLWRELEFVLSATNLTDKDYVAVCQSVNYCNYGVGRQAIGTVRFHF